MMSNETMQRGGLSENEQNQTDCIPSKNVVPPAGCFQLTISGRLLFSASPTTRFYGDGTSPESNLRPSTRGSFDRGFPSTAFDRGWPSTGGQPLTFVVNRS